MSGSMNTEDMNTKDMNTCIMEGNTKGLQKLLTERLAGPNEVDPAGQTPSGIEAPQRRVCKRWTRSREAPLPYIGDQLVVEGICGHHRAFVPPSLRTMGSSFLVCSHDSNLLDRVA